MILDDIIHHKQKEIEEQKRLVPFRTLVSQIARTEKPRDFAQALINSSETSLITEIKLASPSSGKLGEADGVEKRARSYERGGADAISVVVDKKFFGGDLSFIKRIKQVSQLPVLAKDFIINEYQLYKLKEVGADAVLLISKLVTPKALNQFVNLSYSLGVEPIVEIQIEEELRSALKTQARCIAVNARNLTDFTIDLKKAMKLMKQIPSTKIRIGFSGIKNRVDTVSYKVAGAQAVLIGTSLMKSHDPNKLIKNLKDVSPLVKICGIRTQIAAKTCIKAGADLLGFNFVSTSKRYITPEKALAIISQLPYSAQTVGIFQNETLENVCATAKKLNLTFVQLHGTETPEYCQLIPTRVIKTFSLPKNFDVNRTLKQMKKYHVDFYLLDRKEQGTGELLDFNKVRLIIRKFPVLLAGGLTNQNVAYAIHICHPAGIDVASGIEIDGKQNLKLIADFIKNSRGSYI